MPLTAPTTATGSTLVPIDHAHADHWQQALATLGARLPLGWDPTAHRGGTLAGYDLVLATPRTLSALAWFLTAADQPHLTRPIHQARRQAVTAIAVEFTLAVGAHAPTVAGHGYDSARQPWSHAHLVYGALAATNHGFAPLDAGRVAGQAGRHIFAYHLLLRRQLAELIGGELGLGWAPPAPDGACELAGLPARVLATVERPCRPLAEIGACFDSREPR
jgi:hypothetical protein